MTPLGMHSMIELYGCPAEMLDDIAVVREAMRAAVAISRGTLLGECEHRFSPHGVTVVGLLAESHISVHTWPEHCYAAADVFTCGTGGDPEGACRSLATSLLAERFHIKTISRGQAGPP